MPEARRGPAAITTRPNGKALDDFSALCLELIVTGQWARQ